MARIAHPTSVCKSGPDSCLSAGSIYREFEHLKIGISEISRIQLDMGLGTLSECPNCRTVVPEGPRDPCPSWQFCCSLVSMARSWIVHSTRYWQSILCWGSIALLSWARICAGHQPMQHWTHWAACLGKLLPPLWHLGSVQQRQRLWSRSQQTVWSSYW